MYFHNINKCLYALLATTCLLSLENGFAKPFPKNDELQKHISKGANSAFLLNFDSPSAKEKNWEFAADANKIEDPIKYFEAQGCTNISKTFVIKRESSKLSYISVLGHLKGSLESLALGTMDCPESSFYQIKLLTKDTSSQDFQYEIKKKPLTLKENDKYKLLSLPLYNPTVKSTSNNVRNPEKARRAYKKIFKNQKCEVITLESASMQKVIGLTICPE